MYTKTRSRFAPCVGCGGKTYGRHNSEGYCSRCINNGMQSRFDGENEIVSMPNDRRGAAQGMPRHTKGRSTGQPPCRPAIWALNDTKDFPDPQPLFGSFPRGFTSWAVEQLGNRRTLHICSGMLKKSEVGNGVRVDIRASQAPDVIADGRSLPFIDNCFGAVLIDPPYTKEYAESLYQCEYARPSHLLKEAARVVKPGGLIGFVHFLVPKAEYGTRIVRVYGFTQGPGYRIRALTIYRKDEVLF